MMALMARGLAKRRAPLVQPRAARRHGHGPSYRRSYRHCALATAQPAAYMPKGGLLLSPRRSWRPEVHQIAVCLRVPMDHVDGLGRVNQQLRGACQPAAPPAIVALPPVLHGHRCRLRPCAAVRSEQSLGAEDSSLPMLAFGVAALDGLMPKPTQSWPIHSVLRHTATPVPLRPPPFPRTAKAKSWVQRCSSPPASLLLPDRIES